MLDLASPQFQDACAAHPLPNIQFQYGTAGFRTAAKDLDGVAFRVGILAAVRAQITNQHVGIMITASHNQYLDNGVKIVDGSGEMLTAKWEPYATEIANAHTAAHIAAVVDHICQAEGKKVEACSWPYVIIGRDTRVSSETLQKAVVAGIHSVGAVGLVTTPCLHFCVRSANFQGSLFRRIFQLLRSSEPSMELRCFADMMTSTLAETSLHDVNVPAARDALVEPVEDDFPGGFDRSGMTDFAIKLVKQEIAKHGPVALSMLKAETLAAQIEDFMGNKVLLDAGLPVAKVVLGVYRQKNNVDPTSAEKAIENAKTPVQPEELDFPGGFDRSGQKESAVKLVQKELEAGGVGVLHAMTPTNIAAKMEDWMGNKVPTDVAVPIAEQVVSVFQEKNGILPTAKRAVTNLPARDLAIRGFMKTWREKWKNGQEQDFLKAMKAWSQENDEHFQRLVNFSKQSYFTMMAVAYRQLLTGTHDMETPVGSLHRVIVDCANGVGAEALSTLRPVFETCNIDWNIKMFNDDWEDPKGLNEQCGEDYVQKEQKPPVGLPKDIHETDHLATIDGDADRVIYFRNGQDGKFALLDGDRIITLYCIFLRQQLDLLKLPLEMANIPGSDFTLGVVQTAYANGASTRYIRDVLKLPSAMTPTGVKHLHHKAQEYDIGVYFEANGHGTVLFSDKFRGLLNSLATHPLSPEQQQALVRLLACGDLLHPTVGDAIADMFMVEACLTLMKWTMNEWQGVYTDLPSRQTKVTVPNPKLITTVWDETKTLTPMGLQERIDECVLRYDPSKGARAFVRPSGTEPIVRIYAEAETQEQADKLSKDIKAILEEMLK